MHQPSPDSSGLGLFVPPCPPFHFSFPDVNVPQELSSVTCQVLGSQASWEKRCHRKHKRRADDEACSPKRRRLTQEEDLADEACPKPSWPQHCSSSFEAPLDPGSVDAQAQQRVPLVGLSLPCVPCPEPTAAEADGSCMEVEAAQRRLQEIEERITLEDDDDGEVLDEEPSPRQPVLVLSDSLKQGLQGGIGDILPQNVAESVSHSCMQLVLWRPPEDPLAHCRPKDSLHRQRKQQQQQQQQQPFLCGQSPTSCLSAHANISNTPTQQPPQMQLTDFSQQVLTSTTFDPRAAEGPGEEDMEL